MQVDSLNLKAKMDSSGVLRLHERGHNIKNLVVREKDKLQEELKIIDIRWKKIGDTLAMDLAVLTKHSRNLTSIDLSDNYIGDSGCRELASAAATHATLQSLNLSGNRIGDLGAATLSSMLMKNATLRELDLSGNDLNKIGIQGIGGGLRVNSGLRSLRLVENFFGDDGAVELGWALSYNSTLESLCIRSNDITNAGIAMMASGVVRNLALTSLDASDNDITDRGATCLAESLANNIVLRSLDLTLNEIGKDGKDALLDAMDFTSWTEPCGNEFLLALAMSLHPRLGEESAVHSILAVSPNSFKKALLSGKKMTAAEKQALFRAERGSKAAEARGVQAVDQDSPVHLIASHCLHRRARSILFDRLEQHAAGSLPGSAQATRRAASLPAAPSLPHNDPATAP